MSQRLCYRPIEKDEIPVAKEMLALHCPWVAAPDWAGIWVRDEDGRMTGFVGFQRPVIVEPMWCESASAARDLMNWVDGSLSSYKEYEFFVADVNTEFQKALPKHFGLEGKRELPGNHYFVRRENCHRKITQPEECGSAEPGNAAAGSPDRRRQYGAAERDI